MLSFGWSRFILRFPTFPLHFPSLWTPFHAYHLQLVSTSSLWCTIFLLLWKCLSFCPFSAFFDYRLSRSSARTRKSTIQQVFFFFFFFFLCLSFTISGLLDWFKLSVCVSKFQSILRVSFSRIDSSLCI